MKTLNDCNRELLNLMKEVSGTELANILSEVVGYLAMVTLDLSNVPFTDEMTDKLLIPLRERVDNYILRVNARRN